jgi:ribonuclease HI
MVGVAPDPDNFTMKNNQITIYTDGGCDKNPGGTGGWAYLITNGEKTVEKNGREEDTTNNRMELTAAIEALKALTRSSEVQVYTDSQYLSRGITEWIDGWIRHGWRLKDGSPVKNAGLWQELLTFCTRHRVHWNWVKGHGTDPNNIRVDKLVQEAIKGVKSKKPRTVSSDALMPHVSLVRRLKKPVGITIAMIDPAADKPQSKIQVELKHLQGLIEDLIKAQRQAEENL